MKSKGKLGNVLLLSLFVTTLLISSLFVYKWLFPNHQHCIKSASTMLGNFADENQGAYPFSDRGWGDALLKLETVEPGGSWISVFTGVGDDGGIFRRALTTGGEIDESQCSRIYVQGLRRSSNGELAILFDRKAVGGGDHFRSPFKPKLREVINVAGIMKTVREEEWPGFVKNQAGLLRQEGIAEKEILAFYGDWMASE